jgi:two-component system, LytTR family, response regulator
MKPIRTLIVDDEPLARERLRMLLAKEPGLEIVGECGSGTEAVTAVRDERPDLLLLDIQMPELDGFGVLEALGGEIPAVIFVTAFDEHAVRAFEVHALDYLLKPFKPARLKQALERARRQIAAAASGPQGTAGSGEADLTARILALLEQRQREAGPAHLTRIAVRQGDRTRFLRTADVDWIEASGNYLVLHAGADKPMIRETLGSLEEKLPPRQFFRVSRSAIVNLERVLEVQPAFNDEHVVVLKGGIRLPMTRGVRELQDRLKFL